MHLAKTEHQILFRFCHTDAEVKTLFTAQTASWGTDSLGTEQNTGSASEFLCWELSILLQAQKALVG